MQSNTHPLSPLQPTIRVIQSSACAVAGGDTEKQEMEMLPSSPSIAHPFEHVRLPCVLPMFRMLILLRVLAHTELLCAVPISIPIGKCQLLHCH